MISTTIMSHLRWLPPFGALRHHLPPAERWDYKDMKGSLLIVDSTVLLYRWRQPPKRGGDAFPRPQGGCKGFIQTGAFYKFRGALHNPQRHSRCQSSRRNQITLSAPHRTVRAVFPHTALRIVLGVYSLHLISCSSVYI